MDISSISPNGYSIPQPEPAPRAEAAQRRQLIQAARSINTSGMFGHNQLVFVVDPQTHRPIIKVEDRETHEVLLQLPPEYVLRLAQELHLGSAQNAEPVADMKFR